MQGRELTQFVTDFTWYLRNLLLAQSSENIEEVIDVSTENMKRLKAEAEMADMDTTIRYIRIFFRTFRAYQVCFPEKDTD